MSDEHLNAMHSSHGHRVRVPIEVGDERGDSHGGAGS